MICSNYSIQKRNEKASLKEQQRQGAAKAMKAPVGLTQDPKDARTSYRQESEVTRDSFISTVKREALREATRLKEHRLTNVLGGAAAVGAVFPGLAVAFSALSVFQFDPNLAVNYAVGSFALTTSALGSFLTGDILVRSGAYGAGLVLGALKGTLRHLAAPTSRNLSCELSKQVVGGDSSCSPQEQVMQPNHLLVGDSENISASLQNVSADNCANCGACFSGNVQCSYCGTQTAIILA